MRSFWIRESLNSVTVVLIFEREGCVRTEVGVGVTWPQAEEPRKHAGAPRGNGPSPRTFGRNMAR